MSVFGSFASVLAYPRHVVNDLIADIPGGPFRAKSPKLTAHVDTAAGPQYPLAVFRNGNSAGSSVRPLNSQSAVAARPFSGEPTRMRCGAVPVNLGVALPNMPEAQLLQVPTMFGQPSLPCFFSSGEAAGLLRFFEGGLGVPWSLSPDTDLFVLPMLPPVEPPWANAGAPTMKMVSGVTKVRKMNRRRTMLAPKLRRAIVAAQMGMREEARSQFIAAISDGPMSLWALAAVTVLHKESSCQPGVTRHLFLLGRGFRCRLGSDTDNFGR